MLSLKESVQSTRIEGTQVTFGDLIHETSKKNKSSEVIEVENYMEALSEGVDLIYSGNPISTRLIKSLHKILMGQNTRGTTTSAGEYRKIQNFIGPNKNNEDAVYIPVGASEINKYMGNLENYINSVSNVSKPVSKHQDSIFLDVDSDSLIKTAIMHAQFESIHPFLDGNGRMGRILIVLNIMDEGLLEYPVFFVSEELEKERLRYYNLLNGTRGSNPNWYAWINFFLDACGRMANNMLKKLQEINNLANEGLATIDSEGSINKVWLASFMNPSLTVSFIAEHLGISQTTTRNALNRLVVLSLLETDLAKTKNKVYVNYDLLRIL